MNTKLLLLVVSVAAFSSCTTLYKSGQTPDDVYFSPVRPAGGGNDVYERREAQRDEVQTYSSEDRSIRLGINDARWRYLDNNYNYSNSLYINDYSYTPYNYGFNYGYYYNPYFYPYPVYGSTIFVNPSRSKNATPRMTNLGAYNSVYNNTHPITTHGGGMRPVRTYNNNNRGSAVGNVIRQVFSPSNSNNNSYNNTNNNNSSTNNRTYTPATTTNSSSSATRSSSSSAGSGAVSRPPRN